MRNGDKRSQQNIQHSNGKIWIKKMTEDGMTLMRMNNIMPEEEMIKVMMPIMKIKKTL